MFLVRIFLHNLYSRQAVIIIHYVIIQLLMMNRYFAMAVQFSLMNWNILYSLAKSS